MTSALSTIRYAAIAGALMLVSAAPATSQTEVSKTPQENWAVGCVAGARSAPLDCSLEQRLIDSKTGGLLAKVQIRVPGDTKSPVMLVQLPLGIYLPAKLIMDVDGAKSEPAEFQSCDQGGCYVGMQVPAALLDSMLKGQMLNLIIQNQSKQPLSMPISLAGFAKAYGQIQ